MAANLIEQVKEIEAEADRIVAEAQAGAREVEGSVKEEVAALRKAHEQALAEKAGTFARKVERKTDQELKELDQRARAVAERLAAPDQGAVSAAVELVLKRLREG
jgi:Skp family chaperone for outer membrane proteins